MSTVLRVDGATATQYAPVADDAPIPGAGAIQLPLARWTTEHGDLAGRAAPLAVRLPNTVDVSTLDVGVLEANLIVLDFPSFGDGRGYSQARLLRDARGFRGELRATGAAVVRDQLLGMVRCGIDSFELRADQSADTFVEALKDFSAAYQPAQDALPQVRSLRRRQV